MKQIFLADGSIFRQVFYTTAMIYDRREQEPYPPVNIYFCGSKVLVQALVPGLDIDDIRITLHEDSLTLEGSLPRRTGRYLRKERYNGHFRRCILLGTPISALSDITMSNGILQIELQREK